MKSVLITGSNGYIAKNINLVNCNVTLANKNNLNLSNSIEVDKFFEDKYFDVVLHTAIVGGNRLIEDSKDIVYDNSIMAINLLNNIKSWKKLIHFGSGAELDRTKNIEGYSNIF